MPQGYEDHKFASGNVGNSIAQNTAVATLTDPGKGKWKIRVIGRHGLADGLKVSTVTGSGTTDLFTLPSLAGGYVESGEFVVTLAANTDDIIVRLAVATGASETAAAVIFAQRVTLL